MIASDDRADGTTAADYVPTIRPIDLSAPRRIHLIGIGGAGMRAIARVLMEMGHGVSGSDRVASHHVDSLRDLGAQVYVGHGASQIADAEIVARSTAIGDENAEVRAALATGLGVYSRAEVLVAISHRRRSVLVAGTHGKTTTSSMLAVLLDRAGLDPSFIVGADIAHFGTGAAWRTGELAVIEADESDGTALALAGAHGIVTSLDPDHLDHYGSVENLNRAFVEMVERIDGTTAVCVDDPDAAPLVGIDGVVTYGTAADADYRVDEIDLGSTGARFRISGRGRALGWVEIALPGHHNVLNAAAALTLAIETGTAPETAISAIAGFGGVARRFEHRGAVDGITFVDDYAHLPAEVEAAIGAAVAGDWRRVVVTYQPHRYTRTRDLGASFARSFGGADHLVLTDLYTAGEVPIPGVSGRLVLDAVNAEDPDRRPVWQPTLDDVVDHLVRVLEPGDLCLTLGAGDLTTVPDRIIAAIGPSRGLGPPRQSGPNGDIDSVERLRRELGSWVTGAAAVPGLAVEFDAPLGAMTTYRVGGSVAALARVSTRAGLAALVEILADWTGPLPSVLVIGRGSNLLVADRGVTGLAIMVEGDFAAVEIDGPVVNAGAAVALPVLARQTVRAGLTGFEWAVGIPGSIGGAVAMNAGGHGSEMSACVVSAELVDLTTGTFLSRPVEELDFGYRHSSVAGHELVVGATLALAPGDVEAGEAALSEIVGWRRENHPGGQNAGSVFTNPPGDSAGRLLDVAGAKGMRVGSAEVSTRHANFIQVDPHGSADDVFELMEQLQALVRSRFGVELEPETRVVGFDRAGDESTKDESTKGAGT